MLPPGSCFSKKRLGDTNGIRVFVFPRYLRGNFFLEDKGCLRLVLLVKGGGGITVHDRRGLSVRDWNGRIQRVLALCLAPTLIVARAFPRVEQIQAALSAPGSTFHGRSAINQT